MRLLLVVLLMFALTVAVSADGIGEDWEMGLLWSSDNAEQLSLDTSSKLATWGGDDLGIYIDLYHADDQFGVGISSEVPDSSDVPLIDILLKATGFIVDRCGAGFDGGTTFYVVKRVLSVEF